MNCDSEYGAPTPWYVLKENPWRSGPGVCDRGKLVVQLATPSNVAALDVIEEWTNPAVGAPTRPQDGRTTETPLST